MSASRHGVARPNTRRASRSIQIVAATHTAAAASHASAGAPVSAGRPVDAIARGSGG
jgi:hypothetical protein